MASEQATVYVNDRDGVIDFPSIKAALFDCHCLSSGYFGRSDETRWHEYAISVSVPVYHRDWEYAHKSFEDRFRAHFALRRCCGYWDIVRDDKIQWFHGLFCANR